MTTPIAVYRHAPHKAMGLAAACVLGVVPAAAFGAWLVAPPLLAVAGVVALAHVRYQVRLYPDRLSRTNLLGTTTVALGPETRYFYRSQSESAERERGNPRTDLEVDDGRYQLRISARLPNVELLRKYLIANELEQFLPSARAHYLRGGAVDFGPVALRRGVLKVGDRIQTLASVGDMRLYKGRFRVRPRDRAQALIEVPVASIANQFSFFQLVREAYQADVPPDSRLSTF